MLLPPSRTFQLRLLRGFGAPQTCGDLGQLLGHLPSQEASLVTEGQKVGVSGHSERSQAANPLLELSRKAHFGLILCTNR